MVIEIKAYIDGLEEEVKAASKITVNEKKRLLKAQRVLMETNREVDHL